MGIEYKIYKMLGIFRFIIPFILCQCDGVNQNDKVQSVYKPKYFY